MAITDEDWKRMKENGSADYYLELQSFISRFITVNYPLSEEDFRTIIMEDKLTNNVIKRNRARSILREEMKKALKEIEEGNMPKKGNAISQEYSIQDYYSDVNKIAERMVRKLEEEQLHKYEEEQQIKEKKNEEVQEKSIEELADEIKEKIGITDDDIEKMKMDGTLEYYVDVFSDMERFLSSDNDKQRDKLQRFLIEEIDKKIKEIIEETDYLPDSSNLWYDKDIEEIESRFFGRFFDDKIQRIY